MKLLLHRNSSRQAAAETTNCVISSAFNSLSLSLFFRVFIINNIVWYDSADMQTVEQCVFISNEKCFRTPKKTQCYDSSSSSSPSSSSRLKTFVDRHISISILVDHLLHTVTFFSILFIFEILKETFSRFKKYT